MDGRVSRVEDALERAQLMTQSLSVAARAALIAALAGAILWWLPF